MQQESYPQVVKALTRIGELSAPLFDATLALREYLNEPPRIVISGRVKSGKSTLLNALVAAPVAETAALEVTNVVTVYQYGAPDRAEAVLRDGARVPITTRRGEVATLPVESSQVAYVNRWMPTSQIAEHALIDTPGLATLTPSNSQTTSAALIDGFELTREAAVDADAAVFLFDAAPRRDELEFLTRLGFGALNSLGVLSRADSFDEGALGPVDPIDAATRHASLLAKQLSGYVYSVVPVAGLLAETALTGEVTEQFARHVGSLLGRSDESLIRAFLDGGSTDESLAEVVDKIGEYGLFHGREEASLGAAAFTEWLLCRSGLEELRSLINGPLSHFAALQRTTRVIDRIERLAFEYPEHKREIRRVVSELVTSPDLTDIALLRAQKDLLRTAPQSDITSVVTQLLAGARPAEKLGLDADASSWEMLEQVRSKRAWAQGLSFGLLHPAEEQALVIIGRALDVVEHYAESLT